MMLVPGMQVRPAGAAQVGVVDAATAKVDGAFWAVVNPVFGTIAEAVDVAAGAVAGAVDVALGVPEALPPERRELTVARVLGPKNPVAGRSCAAWKFKSAWYV